MVKNKKLLIAGIDPGETKSYALIDIEGRVIKINSSKKLNIELLIREISGHGRIILVGTDVNPCPRFVKKVAGALKAQVYVPEENLRVKRKRQVNNEFIRDNKIKLVKDKHQKDALAIALLALKSVKPLFNKIELHLIQNNKEHLSARIKEEVVVNKIPIRKAVEIIEGS